jgi:hypothetical protein
MSVILKVKASMHCSIWLLEGLISKSLPHALTYLLNTSSHYCKKNGGTILTHLSWSDTLCKQKLVGEDK